MAVGDLVRDQPAADRSGGRQDRVVVRGGCVQVAAGGDRSGQRDRGGRPAGGEVEGCGGHADGDQTAARGVRVDRGGKGGVGDDLHVESGGQYACHGGGDRWCAGQRGVREREVGEGSCATDRDGVRRAVIRRRRDGRQRLAGGREQPPAVRRAGGREVGEEGLLAGDGRRHQVDLDAPDVMLTGSVGGVQDERRPAERGGERDSPVVRVVARDVVVQPVDQLAETAVELMSNAVRSRQGQGQRDNERGAARAGADSLAVRSGQSDGVTVAGLDGVIRGAGHQPHPAGGVLEGVGERIAVVQLCVERATDENVVRVRVVGGAAVGVGGRDREGRAVDIAIRQGDVRRAPT